MRRVGRHAHRLLTWVASLAAVLCLAGGVAVWRLMQGPIELDRLAPYVEAGFARAYPGLRMTIKGVRLGIDRATHQLDLRVEDVHLASANGEPLASFPEMQTSFGLGDLLRGRLAPTRLAVERPAVRLRRDRTGALSLRIGDAAAADAPFDLAAALDDPALARLRRLRIRDATVTVDDALYGRRWQADRLDAALERGEAGIDGDLAAVVALGARPTELHADYRYQPARRKLDLNLAAAGIEPAALASLVPSLEPLARLHVPVSGTLETQFDFDERKFEGLRVDLDFGAGWVETAQFPGGRLDLGGGELHAVYAPEEQRLRLDRLSLALGGPTRVILEGEVGGITRGLLAGGLHEPASLPAQLRIALFGAPVAAFDRLWPLGFSPGGRRWVLANVHDGMLDEAAVRLDLTLDPGAGTATVTGTHGTLRYHDVAVSYFPGLPPAQNVAGTATVADREIDIVPSSGAVKGLKVTGGAVRISDLGAPVETLGVDVAVAGPLRDALDIIDEKPLRYAQAAGIDPERVAGRLDARLHFRLPLLADLKLDAVEYAAKASLSGVSIKKAALDRNLGDGNFTLALDRNGVEVKGEARLDGVPARLDAAMAFHAKSGPRATYRLAMTLDDEARRRLDLAAAAGRLSGPVALDLTYRQHDAVRAGATASFDLREAAVSIAETGWNKPAGQPGTARLVLDLDRDAIVGMPVLTLHAAGLDGSLALGFAHQRVERIDIRRLAIGGDDFAGTVERRRDGGWSADLHGPRLDLRPLFRSALAKGGGEEATPLAVTARFDRVEFSAGHALLGVTAQLRRDGGTWRTLRLDGRYANGRHLAVQLGGAAGAGRLSVASDDFGATVGLLGIADNVVGGQMTIGGNLAAAAGETALSARLDAKNYSLVRASTATRLLSLASLDGLASMLSGSGIPFSTLYAGFDYRGGRIALDRLVAYGGALGVTAGGTIDLDADTIDVKGTVAPAHTLNSALGKLPVVGSLLMGGEGQSLFAASYRLSGSAANPSVSVNPLTALAPGVTRRLFDLPMSGPMPAQPP